MFEAHMGSRLAARRRVLQIDAVQLATRVGVDEALLSAWEAGQERIPPAKLVELATTLECGPSYFFEGLPGIERSNAAHYLRLVGGTAFEAE